MIISVDAEDKPIQCSALNRETMGDPIIYSYYDCYPQVYIPELSRSLQWKDMTESPTPSTWMILYRAYSQDQVIEKM